MALESWLRVSLPALPVAFTVFGVWLYWGENPLPLLAPPLAFWGVVVLFYLFSHLDLPQGRNYAPFLTILASVFWAFAAITSHNLGKFVASKQYVGFTSVFGSKDFWYAYICAAASFVAGLLHFIRYEPLIMEQIKKDRERLGAQGV